MTVVRDAAALSFSAPLDGTAPAVRRRASAARRRRLATRVEGFTVDRAVWEAAQATLRPGERLVIVGPNEVRTAYAR
jgi:hypothetical protein